jgi:hypothetical protein
MGTVTAMAPKADGRQARRNTARALATYYIYDYVKQESDPEWEDLTSMQQQSFRAAFSIGVHSINLVKVLGAR